MSFPSFWDLLIPDASLALIGILIAVVGVLLWYATLKKPAVITWLIAVVLVWGGSILKDILGSSLGKLILGSASAIIIVAIILFYNPKGA